MTSTRTHLLAYAIAIAAAATLSPGRADAQGHRGVRPAAPRGPVVAAYYRPVFYDPFFYDPWFAFPYGWYPPFAYGPYGYAPIYDRRASLRLQVSPRDAEVFINGYYAGTVNNFDGFLQSMHIEPGEHEITLYMPGYRTVTQKILLQPGSSFRVRHTMEALPAGAPPEPRPVAPPGPPPATEAPSQSKAQPQPPASADNASFGAIAIRVQPADAEVLINGERWEGPAADEALVVQLAPGRYSIELRKSGYRNYTAEIEVRAGQTAPLNVSLPQQQ